MNPNGLTPGMTPMTPMGVPMNPMQMQQLQQLQQQQQFQQQQQLGMNPLLQPQQFQQGMNIPMQNMMAAQNNMMKPQPIARPVVDQMKPKRKRPTDKTLPKKIEQYVPESKLYMEMQEFERRLDATITRKTLDIQDALAKPPKKISRTLRIFLSNTSNNQSPQSSFTSPEDAPSWTFKIQGRLLDAPNTRKPQENQPKFSSFLKSVVVEIQRDRELYPQGNLIQWQKSMSTGESDGFEIKRRGDQEVDLKILLYLDEHPEKHKLSPPLAQLLDIQCETLPNIIAALWQYIKSQQLQDPEDRRIVICDEKLQMIFGSAKVMFPNIPELLARHLFQADPIILNYTVRVDRAVNIHHQAYDVEVFVNDPIRESLSKASTGNAAINREIAQLDEKICAMIQSINLSKLKRDFMRGFVDDPVNFINQWVASQSRDLEIVLGDTRLNPEEIRDSKLFENETFKEALFHYLRQKEVR